MRRPIAAVLFTTALLLPFVGCKYEATSSSSGESASLTRPTSKAPSPGSPGSSSESVAAGDIKIEAASFDKLLEKIKANKGKIVVVDFWATWCAPCKKEFPNLVDLHERHAKDGVVCISAAVDEPKQEEAALKFLQSKRAVFANYRLEEDRETVGKRLDAESIPVVMVYDRDGVATKFTTDGEPIYKRVNAKVDELLARN